MLSSKESKNAKWLILLLLYALIVILHKFWGVKWYVAKKKTQGENS